MVVFLFVNFKTCPIFERAKQSQYQAILQGLLDATLMKIVYFVPKELLIIDTFPFWSLTGGSDRRFETRHGISSERSSLWPDGQRAT